MRLPSLLLISSLALRASWSFGLETPDPICSPFPVWPVPARLLVVQANAEDTNWLTTLAVLQGLVNREAPGGQAVWLELLDCRHPPCSPHRDWLDYYRSEANLAVTPITEDALLRWAREQTAIRYYIIFDPETARGQSVDQGRTCTINIACTLAGIFGNALPVHPENVSRLEAAGYELLPDSFLTTLGSAANLRTPRGFDLREQWKAIHSDSPWARRQDAYRWAIETLLPLTDNRAVAFNQDDEARPTGQAGHDFEPWLYDYSAGARHFHFYLEPSPTPANDLNRTSYDRQMFAEILQRTGPLTMVRGWHPDEGDYIRLLSENHCYNGGMAWMPNLSVHAALSPLFRIERNQPTIDPDSVVVDPKAVYLTFTFTDGDQSGVLYRHFWSPNAEDSSLWRDPMRGKVPINWTINAMLYDFARGIMKYFVDEATPNDHFVADLPAGYAWFDRTYFGESLTPYLEMADCYLGLSGLKTADFMPPNGVFVPISSSTILDRMRILTHADAIREGYGGGYGYQGIYWPEEYPLKPYIRNTYLAGGSGYGGQPETPAEIATVIQNVTRAPIGATERPLFLHLTWVNWFTTPTDMATCMELLRQSHGNEYRLVNMADFIALARKAKTTGAYPITFRAGQNGETSQEAPYLWENHGSVTSTRFYRLPTWRRTTGLPGENFVTYKFNVHPFRRARIAVDIAGSNFRVDVSPDSSRWVTQVLAGSGDRGIRTSDVSLHVNANGCFYVRITGQATLFGMTVNYGPEARWRRPDGATQAREP